MEVCIKDDYFGRVLFNNLFLSIILKGARHQADDRVGLNTYVEP